MHAEYLVRMANQIGDFFVPDKGESEAPAAIANHMQRFWERSMRTQLVAHWNAGGAGLSPAAFKAAEIVAAHLAATTPKA